MTDDDDTKRRRRSQTSGVTGQLDAARLVVGLFLGNGLA